MMIRTRIIPCLLLKQGELVKTTKFANPQYVGDPVNAIRIFNDKEVDELIVVDILASQKNSAPDFSLIEQLAGECFMPLCYGGGIRTVEHAATLFSLGIEKVALQTVVHENPRILRKLADRFGSQSIVVSIDIKRDWLGRHWLYSSKKKKALPVPWSKFLRDVVEAGAGEILINSVDRDGTMQGLDLNFIEAFTKMSPVPVIAMGGLSSLVDVRRASEAGASGVAGGAYFVFQGKHRAVLITYPHPSDIERVLR